MSFQITTWHTQQYSSAVQMLVQQKGSRLREAVRVESVTGDTAYFDQVGAGTAVMSFLILWVERRSKNLYEC